MFVPIPHRSYFGLSISYTINKMLAYLYHLMIHILKEYQIIIYHNSVSIFVTIGYLIYDFLFISYVQHSMLYFIMYLIIISIIMRKKYFWNCCWCLFYYSIVQLFWFNKKLEQTFNVCLYIAMDE